jgi:hypothetical protein
VAVELTCATLAQTEPQNLRTSEPQNLRTSEPENQRTQKAKIGSEKFSGRRRSAALWFEVLAHVSSRNRAAARAAQNAPHYAEVVAAQ